MLILNVAEKPSMAKQLSELLGAGQHLKRRSGTNKYCSNVEFFYKLHTGVEARMVMTSVLGHINSLDFHEDYSSWQSVPFQSLFMAPLRSVLGKGMVDVAQNLRNEAKHADQLIIWTDCDREGEYIGWEISEICKKAKPRLRVFRARYSVMTTQAIQRSMENLGPLDMGLVEAAQARSELDLRSGAVFTRFLTLRIREWLPEIDRKVVSYGTCQFPTLGFVVEQYLKIMKFKPDDFWCISVELNGELGSGRTSFTWSRVRLFDRLVCAILMERCVVEAKALVKRVIKKPKSKLRPLPLRTVELQKFASRYLKISSDKVMEIAESLYNGGFISYPRTETDQFDNKFDFKAILEAHSRHLVWGNYVQMLINGGMQAPKKGPNNDQSHPPIHPTNSIPKSDILVGPTGAIYEFIVRRFLACISKDAVGNETTVTIGVKEEEFKATGLLISEMNYLEIYKYDKWSDKAVGSFVEGKSYPLVRVEMTEGRTTAPQLLSEADLIGTMDKNGIGTDATIHEHIKKIIERDYVGKTRENRFHPTNLGVALVLGYDQLGLEESLTRPQLRAALEEKLRKLCTKQMKKEHVISSVLSIFERALSLSCENLSILRASILSNRNQSILDLAPLVLNNVGFQTSRDAISIVDLNDDDDNNNNNDSHYSISEHGAPKFPGRKNNSSYSGGSTRGGIKKSRGKSKAGPRSKSTTISVPKTASKKVVSKNTKNSTKNHGETTIVSCGCGQVPRRLTTMKPGPNHGRKFFSCEKCAFFAWDD